MTTEQQEALITARSFIDRWRKHIVAANADQVVGGVPESIRECDRVIEKINRALANINKARKIGGTDAN